MLLLIPTGVDYRTDRYPVVTFSIMGVNVVIYLISVAFLFGQGEQSELWIYEHLWLTPASSPWYAYLTSMFVHGGFFHILGNMIYLFLFGSAVEDAIGRWKYVIFYLLGGLAAAFVQIAGTPDHFASEIPVGGASGAISACMGGFLILFHKTKINFRYVFFFFFRLYTGDFELPSWLVVSFWFLKDLLFAILSYTMEQAGGGVAFAAHTGGFLAGLGLAALHKFSARWSAPPEPARAGVITVRPKSTEPPTIYVLDGTSQIGPFNRDHVLQMQKLGSISNEAFYWEEGMPEWRAIQELHDSISPGRS